MKKILCVIMCLFILGAGFAAWADDKDSGTPVQLRIKYGIKLHTSRDYEILASHVLKTTEGKMASIEMKDLEDGRGFKMEVTTTIGKENPELMILKIKAWELREVTKDGKTDKEFVLVIDQESRVARGATMVTQEKAGIDRDVVFTITPYYRRDELDSPEPPEDK